MDKPLVILEMANNHMGNISHGKKIINQFKIITKQFENKIDFAFKFQFRDQKTFIHDTYKNSSHKGVKRFEDTFLSKSQWKNLISHSKKKYNLICTPFDEISVKKVFKESFKYVKIASCSATDWPLLEQFIKCYKKNKKKIIASLAGLKDGEISKLISFFNNRSVDIKYLYCVGMYPTKISNLNLSYFNKLKKIYGNQILGFSSHEHPFNYKTPLVAYGSGIRIFEKHVGIQTKKYKLNKYSSNPTDLKKWLDNLATGIEIWGSTKARNKNLNKELIDLNNFKRGVYSSKKLLKGTKLKKIHFKLRYPATKYQIKANDISRYNQITLKKTVSMNKPIRYNDVLIKDTRTKITLIREKIINFIQNKVILPSDARLELSHHYGLEKFEKYGITMINVINNKYCKKIIIMLPGQRHPEQFHKTKEESFFILSGNVNLKLDNKNYILKQGMLKTIKKTVKHKFYSKKGCIIEELSTKSKANDSFYTDKKINRNKDRKSFISLY